MNTGNMCNRYVGPDKRPHIVKLHKFEFPDTQEPKLEKLLQGLNVILRVIASWRQKVDLEKFKPFVIETHLLLHEVFSFSRDNETVHSYLGHCVRAIIDNRGYGLGQLSEVSKFVFRAISERELCC